jgi:hypothetical protein
VLTRGLRPSSELGPAYGLRATASNCQSLRVSKICPDRGRQPRRGLGEILRR